MSSRSFHSACSFAALAALFACNAPSNYSKRAAAPKAPDVPTLCAPLAASGARKYETRLNEAVDPHAFAWRARYTAETVVMKDIHRRPIFFRHSEDRAQSVKYDEAGRVSEVKTLNPDSSFVHHYFYDADNRLISVMKNCGADTCESGVKFEYNDFGQLAIYSQHRGDQVEEKSYLYDSAGRVVKVRTRVSALNRESPEPAESDELTQEGRELNADSDYSHAFNYDFQGRLSLVYYSSEGRDATWTEFFGYDRAGRLSRVRHDEAGTADDYTDYFSYDASGRLTSFRHDVLRYSLLTVRSEKFSYDDAGRLLAFSSEVAKTPPVKLRFEYDAFGAVSIGHQQGSLAGDISIKGCP